MPGYLRSNYTTIIRSHDNWFLIDLCDEGAYCYKQEIVDSNQKTIYRFPYEGIN